MRYNRILQVVLIAIDGKTVIIGHVLINKYDQLLSFNVMIAIWEWIVQYFSSYLYGKHWIFASILLITYKIQCFHVNDLKKLFYLSQFNHYRGINNLEKIILFCILE